MTKFEQNLTDNEYILKYLSGQDYDAYGRHVSEMAMWADIKLEECHDQIQWAFPLPEASAFAKLCPIISPEIAQIHHRGQEAMVLYYMTVNYIRMKLFFGIGDFHSEEKINKWCQDGNHNLLRITRMIRSLRIFGLDSHAIELHSLVMAEGVHKEISRVTLDYWNKALYAVDAWETLR